MKTVYKTIVTELSKNYAGVLNNCLGNLREESAISAKRINKHLEKRHKFEIIAKSEKVSLPHHISPLNRPSQQKNQQTFKKKT